MIGRRIQIAISSIIECILAYVRPNYDAANVTWSNEEVYTMPSASAVDVKFDYTC